MGDEGRENADNPGVITTPPYIYAGALVMGLLANRRLRLPLLPRRLARTLGLLVTVGGFAVGLLGLRELRRAGTNVDPYKPATIVVTGVPTDLPATPCTSGSR